MRSLPGLTLLFLLSGFCRADTITAAYGDWPPFFDAETESGVALEITLAAFASQGYSLQLYHAPWARVNIGVKNQQYDITLGAWWTEERSTFYDYSEPYFENAIKFIKRKGDTFEYHDITSLNGKNIGVVRGYGYDDAFLNADSFKRTETNSLISNVQKLVSHRISLTLDDELVARTTIGREAPSLLEKIEFSNNALTTNQLHVAVASKNPKAGAIITAFNKGLAAIRANGTMARILKPYQQ